MCYNLGMAEPNAPKPKWYFNVWFVLLMLLFVLGPFGLPLVWKHPRWSRWIKMTLTLIMVLYTIALIDATIRMGKAVRQGVEQLNSTLSF